MKPEIIQERVMQLLELQIAGTDMFIVSVSVTPQHRIQVYLDADKGLNIARCAQISRHLERHLEEEELVRPDYTLEVSSPGLDKPLVMLRQYQKNIGREVEVILNDGQKKEGTLLEVNEDAISLNEIVKLKPVKRTPITVPFTDINKTKVKITFKS